ncbi:MAG TPA: phosphate signaling complex protein PhoU [Bryobacteraceae bacterium]|nr:phosphate signaling complex protein PhoU [Bryobacteraceae bacterium]
MSTRPFVTELGDLQSRLLEMGGLVEAAISTGLAGLEEGGRQPGSAEIWAVENRINELNVEIDEVAVRLTALHQPVARDLRFLTAAIKINSDLERMGDLVINVAERVASYLEGAYPRPGIDLPRMSQLVQSMVRRSLDAFVRRDEDLAHSVLIADDEVDDLKDSVYRELLYRVDRGLYPARAAFDLIFVAHNLERIADHATNIAEDVLFLVKGVDVRHHRVG